MRTIGNYAVLRMLGLKKRPESLRQAMEAERQRFADRLKEDLPYALSLGSRPIES